MKWVVFVVTVCVVIAGGVYWTRRPAIDLATFVESEAHADKSLGRAVKSDSYRVTPRVDVRARETVIRWPAYRSSTVFAAPLQLRIKNSLWSEERPVVDNGYIAPYSVALRLDWPEDMESAKRARADEEAPRVLLMRHLGSTKDVLFDAEWRRNATFHTPDGTVRAKAVGIFCYVGRCTMYFDYLGRPVQLTFPRRRFRQWEEAHELALRLLREVGTPIKVQR